VKTKSETEGIANCTQRADFGCGGVPEEIASADGSARISVLLSSGPGTRDSSGPAILVDERRNTEWRQRQRMHQWNCQ
jgi:hypothetical protein